MFVAEATEEASCRIPDEHTTTMTQVRCTSQKGQRDYHSHTRVYLTDACHSLHIHVNPTVEHSQLSSVATWHANCLALRVRLT